MNVLALAALTGVLLLFLWLAQFAAVRWAGDGRAWTWPLGHGSDSPRVRGAMKAALALGVVSLLAGFPLVIGRDPLAYHRAHVRPENLGVALVMMLLTFGALMTLFAAFVWLGWIRLEERHARRKLAGKVLKGLLIPIPLTLMEEPLFRGLLLEQLGGVVPAAWAVVLAALLFAAVHFLRPQKHKVLAAVGLFYTGLMLGAAYVAAGHDYLVPVALHAGGVMFIQVTRPISYYLGPAWLIGRSSYPIAGLLNIAAVTPVLALLFVS